MNNKIIAGINIKAQANLFQAKTLLPSKLRIGIMLKTASHAFICKP